MAKIFSFLTILATLVMLFVLFFSILNTENIYGCDIILTNSNNLLSNYLLFDYKNTDIVRITNKVINEEIASDILFEGKDLDVQYYKGKNVTIIFRIFKSSKEKYDNFFNMRIDVANQKPVKSYKLSVKTNTIDNINFTEIETIFLGTNVKVYDFYHFEEPNMGYAIVIYMEGTNYDINNILKRFKFIRKNE
jgi:hypothetical protein